MQSNLCPLVRLAAQQHNRPQLWRYILKVLLLTIIAAGTTRAIGQLIDWLSLHDLQVSAVFTAGWLEPSAVSVVGMCVVLNAAWIMNLLMANKRWQRRLVSTSSWLVMVSFLSVMLPLSQQLGQLMASRISSFGLAEATLWGMVVLTTSLVWLSGLTLLALLITQTLGFTSLTHFIRDYLATLIGLKTPALELVSTPKRA
jgi:hypothetical protein